jgi:hypothetical protein
MSTVLHPAGPEPAQTYWVRRVAVVGVAIVVLAVAGALIANGTSSGSAVQANPSPPPPAVPTVASGTPTPSAGARASGSATPSGSTSATAKPSATATATASAKASASATPKPTPTPTPEPVTCAASALRPTLTGKQQLRPRQRNTFTLSLINGSDQTCTVTVNRDNFELRIYSGSDRIWSTKDCATIVKPRRRTLEAEQAIEWKLSWNGRRSRTGCMSRPEIPRPGTYYATAELAGAEPVRLLMTLRA